MYFGSRARETAVTAQNDRRLATARELASAALNNLTVDPERSILLALQSAQTTQDVDRTVLPETVEALHHSIVASPIRLTLGGFNDRVVSTDFSLDGTLMATGGFAGTAKIWNASTGNKIHELAVEDSFVLGVAFSPDGSKLATSSTDANARIWDTKTGELLLILVGHRDPLPDIAYSPDGTKVATASQDGTAIVWDANTGSKLITLIGHGSELQAVAFSPDGKTIATGSGDNTAKLWETETGKEILTLPGSMGGVFGVAFSPLDGGAQLAVASTDGVVRGFLLDIDKLLALAEPRVTRSLTTAECEKFLHVEQCPSNP